MFLINSPFNNFLIQRILREENLSKRLKKIDQFPLLGIRSNTLKVLCIVRIFDYVHFLIKEDRIRDTFLLWLFSLKAQDRREYISGTLNGFSEGEKLLALFEGYGDLEDLTSVNKPIYSLVI